MFKPKKHIAVAVKYSLQIQFSDSIDRSEK